MFETSFYSYLTSKTAITNLVTGIYANAAPNATAFPHVTYHILSKERDYNNSGASGRVVIHVSVDVWSTTYADTVTVAEAIRNEFDAFAGNLSGTTVQGAFIDSESDNPVPPPDNSGNWIFHREIVYRVIAIEAKPVRT